MADLARRSGFAPTVLAGIGTAVLASVAAAKPWFRAQVDHRLAVGVADPEKSADMPLALALALVVLAGWGVLLVTRGRFRRGVATAALLAAVGTAACVVAAPFSLPDDVRDRLPDGGADAHVTPTGWYVTAAVAVLLSIAVLVLTWLRLPAWPTMGSRYDAPAARSAEPDETDLWKALDEGHDPTDPSDRSSPPSP